MQWPKASMQWPKAGEGAGRGVTLLLGGPGISPGEILRNQTQCGYYFKAYYYYLIITTEVYYRNAQTRTNNFIGWHHWVPVMPANKIIRTSLCISTTKLKLNSSSRI